MVSGAVSTRPDSLPFTFSGVLYTWRKVANCGRERIKIKLQAMIIGLLVLNTSLLNADGMQTYFADFVNPAVLWDIDSTTAALTVPPAYAACASDPANDGFTPPQTGWFE